MEQILPGAFFGLQANSSLMLILANSSLLMGKIDEIKEKKLNKVVPALDILSIIHSMRGGNEPEAMELPRALTLESCVAEMNRPYLARKFLLGQLSVLQSYVSLGDFQ